MHRKSSKCDLALIDPRNTKYENIDLFIYLLITLGIAYNKHSGKIVGFTDLGNINNEVEEFQLRCSSNKAEHRPIATHVLTIMVRGINFPLQFPIAYFAGTGFKGYQLFPVLWEAVRSLEYLDMKVWFVASDGAAPNRKFYRLHNFNDNKSSEGVVYWTYNRYAPRSSKRKIFFICDVPHLIKTIRNNFANSHAHRNTRELYVSIEL